MPTSVQWNTGLQFTLPWASVMDVEYVGNHSYNLLEQTDINAPDFGAAYLPQNQNPTLAPNPLAGANALPTNFYRPYRGYGAINRRMTVGYNNFHSLQTSWNRRFRDGLQFTLNYTLSRNKGTAGNGAAHHPRREQQHRAARRLRTGELPASPATTARTW